MEEFSLTNIRVHNEVEFCRVKNPDIKKKLESLFQNNRISYYEKWEDDTFFKRLLHSDDINICTFCINEMQREKALELLEEHGDLLNGVQLVSGKVKKTFFY